MLIKGLKCPNCGAALEAIDDVRKNIFCSYCGCALNIEYNNDETEAILKIKQAEQNLNLSKAELARENAHFLEAEAKNIKYKEKKFDKRRSRTAGFFMIILFAGLAILEVWGIIRVITSGVISFTNMSELAIVFVIFGSLFALLIFSGFLIGIGDGFEMLTGEYASKIAQIENRIERLIKRKAKLEEEYDRQYKIIQETEFSLFGEKAQIRRSAERRCREIREELKKVTEETDELERRL